MRVVRPAAAFVSLMLCVAAPSTMAAENGPMSSGYKPNAPTAEAVPEQPPGAGGKGPMDVRQLFANTCGWCHSDGGRAAGKGPQLMDTKQDDDFVRDRIKNGKSGAMQAFGSMFSDAQIDQIIKYIRELKSREG